MNKTVWLVRWKLLGMPAYLPDGQMFATIPEEAFNIQDGCKDIRLPGTKPGTPRPSPSEPVFIWCINYNSPVKNQMDALGISVKRTSPTYYTVWTWGPSWMTAQLAVDTKLSRALREGLRLFIERLENKGERALAGKAHAAAEAAC